MMKLFLLICFWSICFVDAQQVTIKNKVKLIKVGDPLVLECDRPSAKWVLSGKSVANCRKCPSTCDTDSDRYTAFCSGGKPELHIKSAQIKDKTVKCSEDDQIVRLRVGNYNPAHLDSENKSPFALDKTSYTLQCNKEVKGDLSWYDEQGKTLRSFNEECLELDSNYNTTKFNITCEQKKGKLHIKHVTLNEDGTIFGCESDGKLSLFNLIVNVPVKSVSIQVQQNIFIFNKNGIFVCIVGDSKPEPTFQWIITYKNGSTEEIKQGSSISKKAKGKRLQTNSTLTLNLKRDYQKIMCKARIGNLPWENSEYKELDIKYPPEGKPNITMSESKICAGKVIDIKCEWKGGNPEASVQLTCLSKRKNEKNSVRIRKKVYEGMNGNCTCIGSNLAATETTTKELDIYYPPKEVRIDQTSYLEGTTADFICIASNGHPTNYKYSWLPSKYPSKKTIEIKLTKDQNKDELTCRVEHECNSVSATIPINVEYKPIIKMNNSVTVIENQAKELRCPVEGNPTPKIKWKIGQTIVKKELLQISFTRNNASTVQCIATANSSKHGTLESSKNISINVTYPPEITMNYHATQLQQHNANITCDAQASPDNILYKLVQKWGRKEKRVFDVKKRTFQKFSYNDLGEWICMASNGVPTHNHYINKSVEIKVKVAAQFIGDKNQTALVGSQKHLKICFYCYPEATEIKWYKEDEEMFTFFPEMAEDGLFPFTGNCSILKLDITEKGTPIYRLKVTNPIGSETFEVSLNSGVPDKNYNNIIIACVTAIVIIIIVIGVFFFVRYRRSSSLKKSPSNKNPEDDTEMINNSLYDDLAGVTNSAALFSASDVEPLYAQVNKPPQKSNKVNNANVEDLYATVDKSKKPKPQDKNASDVEPLYAQVNKPPKKLNKVNNANVEDLYATVDKSKKPKYEDKNANVEDLYATVDKSKKPKYEDKNAEPLYAQVNKPPKKLTNVNNENPEDLYATVDKSKKPQLQEKKENPEDLYATVDKSKKPQLQEKKENPEDLYATVDKSKKPQLQEKKEKKKPAPKRFPVVASKPKPVPRSKPKPGAEPIEDIYENVEIKDEKAEKADKGELMYVDLEFLSDRAENKKDAKKVTKDDETMYASIDFS